MPEEEVAAAARADVKPVQCDRKRKLEDFEPHEEEVHAEPQEVAEAEASIVNLNANSNGDQNSVPDAKRPRLEDSDISVPAVENGHQFQKLDEKLINNEEQPPEGNDQGENAENQSEGNIEKENAEQSSLEKPEAGNAQEPSIRIAQAADGQHSSGKNSQQPTAGVPEQGGDLSSAQQQPQSDEGQNMSCKMEVPNNKHMLAFEERQRKLEYLESHEEEAVQPESLDWNAISIEVQNPIPDEKGPRLDDFSDNSKYILALENAAQLSEGNLEAGNPQQPCTDNFQTTDCDDSSVGDSQQEGDLPFGQQQLLSDDQTMSSEMDIPNDKREIFELQQQPDMKGSSSIGDDGVCERVGESKDLGYESSGREIQEQYDRIHTQQAELRNVRSEIHELKERMSRLEDFVFGQHGGGDLSDDLGLSSSAGTSCLN